MNSFSHVPPGFRFHPTDEELVDYYLRKKVASKRIEIDFIKDIDLYKIEPWDLLELCKIGHEEQSDWYFFSHKDKKYPTGTRTNRATKAGFWKATGRDKAIYLRHSLIGMRKTLVFYMGRAPNGQKSDWIMHEYRLETDENGAPQEEGWVVCRVFKKRLPAVIRRMGDYDSSPSHWYDEQLSFMASELETNGLRRLVPNPHQQHQQHLAYGLNASAYTLTSPNLQCKQELELQYSHLQSNQVHEEQMNQGNKSFSSLYMNSGNGQTMDQVTDWRSLDKFVASQLSNEEATTASASLQNNAKDTSNVEYQIDEEKDQKRGSDFSTKSFTQLKKRIEQVITRQASVHMCNATVDFLEEEKPFFPPTVNDKDLHMFFKNVSGDMLGTQNYVEMQPLMGSEDFSFYQQAMPGHFSFVGMQNEAHSPMASPHSPYFEVNEELLPYGASLHASMATRYLLDLKTSSPNKSYQKDEL